MKIREGVITSATEYFPRYLQIGVCCRYFPTQLTGQFMFDVSQGIYWIRGYRKLKKRKKAAFNISSILHSSCNNARNVFWRSGDRASW